MYRGKADTKKNMRFLRSKLFISIILIVLAGFLTFVMLPKMYGAQSETVDVVNCSVDVSAGTKITESMLVVRTVGKYGLSSGVLTSKDAVVGKYAAIDIHKDTNLYQDMFSDDYKEISGGMDTEIKAGQKLVTISLNGGSKSVGGTVRPGDMVDVLTEMESQSNGYAYDDNDVKMELTTLLRGVTVYAVLNASLGDISELNRTYQAALANAQTGEKVDFSGDLTPAYVTFIVSDEQAIALANQEYSGTVHLVLYPDVTEESYLAELNAPAISDEEVILDEMPVETPAA